MTPPAKCDELAPRLTVVPTANVELLVDGLVMLTAISDDVGVGVGAGVGVGVGAGVGVGVGVADPTVPTTK